MHLINREFRIERDGQLLAEVTAGARGAMGSLDVPVRLAVTKSVGQHRDCELGVLCVDDGFVARSNSIFTLRRRERENRANFTGVMLVPTGIGAEIGGHAGDASPAARLLASVCDTLITHPNVVNASDINELPANGLYVEGSVISDLLMGTCALSPVRANRILVVIDKHPDPRIAASAINAVSAARATLGIDCAGVVEIDPPLGMRAAYSDGSGTAGGVVTGLERVSAVLASRRGSFDAVALASVIEVPHEYHTEYFVKGGDMVNPWGGVEALLTHAVSRLHDVPAAHAPMFESAEIANLDVGVVDPRMAAEAVSATFLHCVLKGLYKSPQIVRGSVALRLEPGAITVEDISCLVIPDGCIGLPTIAAVEQGIPVIAVRENRNIMRNDLAELPFAPGNLIIVENYWEAAGVMAAMKAGVHPASVRRPLSPTRQL